MSNKKEKRNKKTQKNLKNKLPRLEIETTRIKRHKFNELRENADFIDLLRVARAFNYLMSGLKFLKDCEGDTPVISRQRFRAFYIITGYIYETNLLVASLRNRHGTKIYFKKLFELIYDDKYKKHRKIIKEVRDQGFHLDHENKSTKKALEKLDLPRYDFIKQTLKTKSNTYFELTDMLDTNYLIDVFNEGKEDEKEVFIEIQQLSSELALLYSRALDEFMTGLVEEMNFNDYCDLIDINF